MKKLLTILLFVSLNAVAQNPTAPVATWIFTTSDGMTVDWTASTDADGIRAYHVFVGGVLHKSLPNTYLKYTIEGLSQNTSYNVTIKGVDNNGNLSTASNTITKTTLTVWAGSQSFTGNSQVSTAFGSLNISGYHFTNIDNVEAQNGNGLRFFGCSGVTITDCFIGETSGGSVDANAGIYLSGCSDFTFERCFFTKNGKSILVSEHSDDLVIRENEFLNVHDRCYVQLIECDGAGYLIEDNRGENFFGESLPEDITSVFGSTGTSGSPMLIQDNLWRGGGPSKSGGGGTAGDNGAGSGGYIEYRRQKLMNVGQYGLGAVGGTQNKMIDNWVWGEVKPWTNVGYTSYAYGGFSCTNVSYTGNKAHFICGRADLGCTSYTSGGSLNNTYFACAECTFTTGCPHGSEDVADFTNVADMGFPDVVILKMGEDKVWKLRDDMRDFESHFVTMTTAANAAYGYGSSIMARPIANAGADQPSVTATSATLTSSSTAATSCSGGGTAACTLTGYRWVQVSGPNTATIVSPTSSSTSVTGLMTGVYEFRLEAEQTSTTYFTKTWDADWMNMTVNIAFSPNEIKVPFKIVDINNYKHNWAAK